MSPDSGGREQLLHLLAEAAEIEHNLLCCYLYAAFSLKRPSATGLFAAESRVVERWRKSLMTIAFEEMTHLAIVANLTVAVGARPHFNRPNLPVDPGYHPASIVVKLAAGWLMPAAPDYETLAEFYAEIRKRLVSLSDELGEKALFCGVARTQIGEESLQMPGLTAIDDLPKALAAIDTIVEQGEGSDASAEESHFSRFTEMRKEYERGVAERADFEPAWPVATNPVMRKTHLSPRVHVDSERAAEVLDLANALYNLLLRVLTQAYGRGAPVDRGPTLALDLMTAFALTGEYLATLPARDYNSGVHAGVSFTILRATEPLTEGRGERRLLDERLEQLRRRTAALCDNHPELHKVRQKLDTLAAP